MRTVKVTQKHIHVIIRNESAKSDKYCGRVYNVFSKLHKDERLKLGYIEYDMSTAMQAISLQLIKATEADYPLLSEYVCNKKEIRIKISTDLGITVEEVKEMFTAFANGKIYEGKYEYYRKFCDESVKLRREVTKYASQYQPELLKGAIEQSPQKTKLPKVIDWTDTTTPEAIKEMRAKSSVFFFVWTYYEYIIREAMLTLLTDGVELHDAVYSKMDIEPSIIEQAIHEHTGFNMIIG